MKIWLNLREVILSSHTASVQFSCSVMSDSLWPHGLQHTKLPCPLPTPGVYSDSCPLSWWCHPIISSSVIPFSSCLQSFPASESFPMSQLFASASHQVAKVWSFSFSISPSNEYSGLISFSMAWLDLFSVQGTLKSLLQHHSSKASILQWWAFFIVQLSHPYMTTGKTIALTRWTFVGKVMSLLFNMLFRLVITFLPWSKCLRGVSHTAWHSAKGAYVCLQVALLNHLLNDLIAKLNKYVYSLSIITFVLDSKNLNVLYLNLFR